MSQYTVNNLCSGTEVVPVQCRRHIHLSITWHLSCFSHLLFFSITQVFSKGHSFVVFMQKCN